MNRELIAGELVLAAKELVAGATTFYNYGKGNNARKIFNDLVQDARYDHGNQGYTGTIAEKDGFKIVSDPVTQQKANEIADDKIDRNDKWGPAFAIPIVGASKPKVVKINKTVFATKPRNAVEALKEELRLKYRSKGFEVSFTNLGDRNVELSRSVALSLKKVPTGFPKPKIIYKIRKQGFAWLGSGYGHNFNNVKDAREFLKQHVANKDVEVGSVYEINAVLESVQHSTGTPVESYEVSSRSKKGNKYLIQGEIEIAKPSTKVVGYYFFGWASE